jgi:hypothetical protein
MEHTIRDSGGRLGPNSDLVCDIFSLPVIGEKIIYPYRIARASINCPPHDNKGYKDTQLCEFPR